MRCAFVCCGCSGVLGGCAGGGGCGGGWMGACGVGLGREGLVGWLV